MAILDNIGITSENPDLLFGLNADTFFMDSTITTFKTNAFAINTVTSVLGTINTIDEPEARVMAMPVSGKIIGVIWLVEFNSNTTPTMTINILKNGVEVGTAVLVIPALTEGYFISETLNLSFVAGDRIQIQRVRSGSTTAEIRGVFGVAVKWD